MPAAAWHTHELLFGYGLAVVAGFLLTAIPNWTGRLPLAGRPLLALVGLWLAGRLAVALAAAVLAQAWLWVGWIVVLAVAGRAAAVWLVRWQIRRCLPECLPWQWTDHAARCWREAVALLPEPEQVE